MGKMETELFGSKQSLLEIHSKLLEHLREDSDVTIYGDGRIRFFIPENGYASHWFDDLIEIIAIKIAKGDKEILKFCIERGIKINR